MTFTVTQGNSDEIREQVEQMTADFRALVASFGYEASYTFWDNGHLQLSIKAVDNDYLPDINFDRWDFRKTGKLRWRLNMAAYGSLYGEELQKWFAAQKAGMDLIEKLEELDFKKIFPELIFED